jgi:WD40 repeat protein
LIIEAPAFSPDSSHILIGSQIWNLASEQPVADLEIEYGVSATAFSPDGTRVMTVAYSLAEIWDTTTREKIASLETDESRDSGGILSIFFGVDGARVLTEEWNPVVKLWDVARGELIASFAGHTNEITAAVLSPDGTRVATASDDGTARIWDSATGQSRLVLVGHAGAVVSIAFSPDGDRVVTASRDTTSRIWDTRTGQTLRVLKGHTGDVVSGTFSPDGKQVATSSWDNTARIWDAASGQTLAILRGHGETVTRVLFSPDGSQAATISDDGTARLWVISYSKRDFPSLARTSGGVFGQAVEGAGERRYSVAAL